MSGFIKGIVVGLGSFGLGFVVLSVVLPVDAPGRLQPSPAQVEAERQAEVDLVPATAAPDAPSVTGDTPAPAGPAVEATAQEPATQSVDPVPSNDLVAESEGLDPAPADPATQATPVETAPEPSPSVTPPADASPRVQDPPAAPRTALTPPLPDTDRPDPQPASAANAQPDSAPAEAEAPVVEPAPVEPMGAASETGPSPVVTLPSAADAPPLAAGATDTPGAVTAPAADATPLAQAGTALAQARSALVPTERSTVERALPDTTAPAMPQPEPPVTADPVPQPAPEPTAPAESQSPLAPVPAARVPLSEPLLPRAPGFAIERPPVQPMPTGTPQVAVRRGATADSAPRQVEGVTVGRLARIGAPVPEGSTAEPTPDPADPGLSAAQRFAAQPAISGDERPLGVVLTDSAASQSAILALGVPVTVALDPYDADAPRRAAEYRSAGYEIALLAARMPALATPADLTVILDAWMRDFPETVALMDVPLNGVGANPTLARDLTAMLAVDGYAAIALRGGLDAFLQAAEDSDLPAVAVYREIDSAGQSEIAVRRMIDRAAFEALRRPGILIAGSADDRGLMTELADFAQGRGRSGVALAPASAVLSAAR
ncbi:divergent polysaccharide deacetylase family protein [Pararhodobacter zhoushanensis]|uniref:Divergent polysaccharide deacetylase family protein n=1 Tax=Pararhodobacter zhoushanensis TaxID=2479545 RepID=A0ABT3GY28_9RHOB|nr:divergent polysaccharide deacetylase family protein [Pararhodobacter zhoushanensis]MCW1932471.1 divergent polysaccharide deacetylase family protein [Pararhodobacter zhoushanensis]